MPTPVLRPGQKGTPQKCQNLGRGGGSCHQMPTCSHYTPATHVTCWHTFSLLVRSTYRDTSSAYLKSQPPHRQTVQHSGHGVGGGLPAPGRAVPSKPPLRRGPGVTALPLEAKHQARAAQNDSGSLTLNPKLSQEGHHEFLKRQLGESLRLTQLWL